MWESLTNWLGEHYPIALLVIVVIALTWFCAVQYFKWTGKINKTEKDCNAITPQLAQINGSLNSLHGSFNSLVIYLKGKDGKMDANLFMSRSPIQLTELGERLLITIGGKDFVDTNASKLIGSLDEIGIKTALDAQTNAPIVISNFSTTDAFTAIKNYVFLNPYYKEPNNEGQEITIPLDMGTITNVMGIYLRDKYLSTRPDLKAEDIPTIEHII